MKYHSLSFLFILLLFVTACSSPETLTVSEKNNPITINGNLTGWDTGSSIIKSDNELNIYATREDHFLYLFVDVRGILKDRAMRQSGFIVYIGDSKDNRRNKGIGFPSGTFNLLRENPGVYQSFLNDREWSQNPANREMLENLSENIFSRVMVIERYDGSDTQYGFIDLDQLSIDGLEIATNEDRRLLSIEMKIPVDGSSVYDVNSDRIWVGFVIDPPNFRISHSEYEADAQHQRRGQMGNRQPSRNTSAQRESALRRNLGEYEEWFILRLND